MKTQLKIEGMSCGHCVVGVKNALQSVEGVVSADVSLEKGLAEVEHEAGAKVQALIDAVEEEGYHAEAM